MALRRRGGASEALNPWPGYVDALSTLLMVIIFVLLVFVLAQAFLSVALTGRDRALDRVNRQMAELADMLALEKGRTGELQSSIALLNRDLLGATAVRDSLAQQLAAARVDQDRLSTDRDALKSDRDRMTARLADSGLQVQSGQARAEQLQTQIADAARRAAELAQANSTAAAASQKDLAARALALTGSQGDLAAAQKDLAATQARLAEMQRQAGELDRTVQADRATITARLADLARLSEQLRAVTALRDELEQQAQAAAARTVTDAQARAVVAAQLAEEQRLGESGRARIALLTQQMDALRGQLAQLSAALDASEKSAANKDVQIVNLGSKLNAALAQKVEELQRYRSDFFGRLREVLANRPGVQVVGDRFVFQSEVLFPVGGAEMSPAGAEQIRALATTLLEISREIPREVNWLMRVDGHADRQPVQSSRFPSNWELSTARAITVVKMLVAEGVPAERLAATGFGDNQPLDGGATPEAFARNRRIELRLTDR